MEIIESLARDETTNSSRVSDFIRDFLTLETKNIPNKGKVYQEFKNNYPTSTIDDLEFILLKLKSLAKFYNKLINPKNELDKDIRLHIEYISRLEINVAYPFLMKVYEDYGNNLLRKENFISILNLIQSFTWRRFIIGLATNALNKIFMNFYDKIDKSNYLYSIQKALIKLAGNSRFPQNIETLNALKEKDVYSIKTKNRTYLLERLENFENKELVFIENNPDITVEHIFPQNPDPRWKIELGQEEYDYIRENYLNTVSNLTLSGNNGKLSNKYFTEKRDLPEVGYKDSRLWLNKQLSKFNLWNRETLDIRFNLISERFLKVWSYPEIEITNELETTEVNIFEADEPRHKKLEYAIFFNQKIEVREVAKLYVEVFKQLFDLQPESFFNTDIGNRIGLTNNPIEGNPRQAIALNDTYFIEGNIDNNGKFDRIKQALTVFNCEDELLIKYSENLNNLQFKLDYLT